MQGEMFQKALKFQLENTFEANSMNDFIEILNDKGGFISAHWDGTSESEQAIQNMTKASIRCIPQKRLMEEGKCIYSGKPSKGRVVFARAY